MAEGDKPGLWVTLSVTSTVFRVSAPQYIEKVTSIFWKEKKTYTDRFEQVCYVIEVPSP